MAVPLRLLNIEESELDSYAILHELRSGGYEVKSKRAQSESEFRAALEEEDWDIIISSYYLPDFGGMDALNTLREMGKEIPLVIVSQPFGDNYAALAMRVGAKDFLLKNNLSRLVPVVTREVRQVYLNREHKRVEEDLRRKTEHMIELARISMRFHLKLDTRAVFRTLCEETVNNLKVTAAAVYLYDPKLSLVRYEEGFRMPLGFCQGTSPVPMEKMGFLPHKKQVSVISDCRDILENPEYRLFRVPNLRSMMIVKIQHGRKLFGFLAAIENDELHVFSDVEQLFINELADHAAMAFSNAQLYEACQNRADQYLGIITLGRALYETGDVKGIYALVTDTINEILPNISNIFISNYEPLQGRITCVYGYQDNKSMDVDVLSPIDLELPGIGTQSEAIYQRRPVIVNNLREGTKKVKKNVNIGTPGSKIKSGLFVPMVVNEQVRGVIQVQSTIKNRFNAEDADMLGLIANTTAIALEKARLPVTTILLLEQLEDSRRRDKSKIPKVDPDVT